MGANSSNISMIMKIPRNILTILLCMTLFQSSCDLLSDTEAEVMEDLKVEIWLGIFVFEYQREWDQLYTHPAAEDVHVILSKTGAESDQEEILFNQVITREQMSTGIYQFNPGTYYMHKGEVFTISVHLEDYPNEHNEDVIIYEEAKKTGMIVQGEPGVIKYNWGPNLVLIVPTDF
jgi:hypothetical protein